MNLPAVRSGSRLVLDAEQDYWTDAQVRVLNQLGVKDANPADLAVFFHYSQRTGLDPFARQIYMVGRKAKENDRWVTKQTIQTGIDGFRLVARRAADRSGDTLGYSDPQWCGPDGHWVDVWLDEDTPPAAARITVLRGGQPFPGIARWKEFAQTTSKGDLTPMWARMPSNQLAKCAEAQALRRAFPQDLSGMYVDEEMSHLDQPQSYGQRRGAAQKSRLNEMLAQRDVQQVDPVPEADPDADAAAEYAEEQA